MKISTATTFKKEYTFKYTVQMCIKQDAYQASMANTDPIQDSFFSCI